MSVSVAASALYKSLLWRLTGPALSPSLSACIRVSGCGARKDIVCLIVEMAITFLLLICVCATLRIPARDLISRGLQCVTV